ncbi:MAG: Holliday junction branch migration protein RuvA [Candidatus Latescibacteria bacterium]|nr:Holliday junction branch migration protein RuvA [Candidatus Latescibacterota bacterium]
MITHLRGRLVHKAPTRAVVEAGGIGYEVAISLATYGQLPESGAEVLLLTHHHVREDRQDLFGFVEEAEREMFRMLIGISGIGPVLAQTVLSGMAVRDLQEAIFHERVRELTGIKGIGKKTAERMIIELKDKVELGASAAAPGAPAAPRAVEEAVLALTALGIASLAARQAVQRVIEKEGAELSVQQLIKRALQER